MVESAFAVQDETDGAVENTWNITLTEAGGINPSTALLTKEGNTWTLNSDITGTITVKQNNIVLDGNNHTLTVPYVLPFTFFGGGISLDSVSRTTVMNFNIKGGTLALGLMGSDNNITGNYLGDNYVGISFMGIDTPSECQNNYVIENTFTNCSTALMMWSCQNNHIYYNNFMGNERIVEDAVYVGYPQRPVNVNFWDDGGGRGNFWSDYLTRYPNATESGISGLGDTPYFVRPASYRDPANLTDAQSKERYTQINAEYAQNVDHYPLMTPYNGTLATPEGFPTIAVIVLAVIAAAFGAGGIIYYKKHRNRNLRALI
jgi:hypothetical protein